MKQNLNLIAAVAAGLAGSAVMHYLAPIPVFAQDTLAAPAEIRAHSVTLVDGSNNVVGTFTTEPLPGGQMPVVPQGNLRIVRTPSRIVLKDASGKVIWAPESGTKILPLTMR